MVAPVIAALAANAARLAVKKLAKKTASNVAKKKNMAKKGTKPNPAAKPNPKKKSVNKLVGQLRKSNKSKNAANDAMKKKK
jgi:hypothetical protein